MTGRPNAAMRVGSLLVAASVVLSLAVGFHGLVALRVALTAVGVLLIVGGLAASRSA
jgi:succinate dehydrogenase/fumarate reductase cytochrome b subunit